MEGKVTYTSIIEESLAKTRDTIDRILASDYIEVIEKISKKVAECYKNGGKLIIAGNGGSAADAQHIAGEFVSRFLFDRPGLPAIAVTTDTSILTAIGNDYGYEKLFARQIQAQGKPGDVFIGISTSGNSPNIVEGLKTAKELGMITVGFTGEKIGAMQELCDYCFNVPSTVTPNIQEAHITVGHIMCGLVERDFFRGDII